MVVGDSFHLVFDDLCYFSIELTQVFISNVSCGSSLCFNSMLEIVADGFNTAVAQMDYLLAQCKSCRLQGSRTRELLLVHNPAYFVRC